MIVLGIDAADYRLAKQWGLENLLLDNHKPLETISHSLDVPATIEVWPTIATGIPPEEHGLSEADGNRLEWGNPILKLGSRATRHLPPEIRYQLGRPFQGSATLESAQIDSSYTHMFESGYVRNWPGITPARRWGQASEWFGQVTYGEISEEEYLSLEISNDAEMIGWLKGHAITNTTIAGAHIHGLDHLGHIYGKRPEKLREGYEIINQLVGDLREATDDLVIMSDHGMQQTATDDAEPGVHSWHAMISTTMDGPLPDTVLDVCSWVEERISDNAESQDGPAATIDAPTDHLKNLGYLD